MGRPLREILDNSHSHIYSRFRNCEHLMSADEMKELFQQVIIQALKKYKFKINAFVLMETHIHMIIYTIAGEATISQIMQYIKGDFARKYNIEVDRMGPVWNERFGSIIVETRSDPNQYLKNLLLYQWYNPVKAGLVKKPLKYRYSSIRCYYDNHYNEKSVKNDVPVSLLDMYVKLGSTNHERYEKLLAYGKSIYKNNIDIFLDDKPRRGRPAVA